MTRADYARAVKQALGIHADTHGFFLSWMLAESGTEPCDGHSGAAWNPLNTTWRTPGSTSYNSVGVQNYHSADEGIGATVRTLRLGYYADIVAACKAGSSLGHLCYLVQHSPWGTGAAIYAGAEAYKRDEKRAHSLTVG